MSKKTGHIYIIEMKNKDHVKIGISRNLKIRMRNHETGTGFKIKKMVTFGPFNDYGKLEKKIFEHLKSHRLDGEWFNLNYDFTINRVREFLSHFTENNNYTVHKITGAKGAGKQDTFQNNRLIKIDTSYAGDYLQVAKWGPEKAILIRTVKTKLRARNSSWSRSFGPLSNSNELCKNIEGRLKKHSVGDGLFNIDIDKDLDSILEFIETNLIKKE